MNIGIIGLGSIGTMLVKAFVKSNASREGRLIVFNRTREKAEHLQAEYGILIADSAQEVCEQADVVFVCTKPLDILPLLGQLSIPVERHVVSVAAGVSIEDLERVHTGAVSKVIPTVTSQELRGVSLFTCSQRLSRLQREQFIDLLGAVGAIQEVSEEVIETATILTSSAPGLIAGILESFAQAAVRQSPQLPIETARSMLVETMLGTALLLQKERLGFDQLIERVATKGGITEEGLRVLDKSLPASFDELFSMTQAKHDTLKQLVRKQTNE